jgi:hypothetical protein
MANPEVIDCSENVWNKVATAVTNCQVKAVSPSVELLLTIRDTGDAAPDNGETEEGVELTVFGLVIQDTNAKDVYVWTATDGAQVRVYP